MAERDRSDLVDRDIDELMAHPDTYRSSGDFDDLLQVAASLRDLPRPEFRERLKALLRERGRAAERRTAAATPAAPPPGSPIAAHNPRAALFGLPAGGRRLASFNDGQVGVERFSGRTPWERHPGGDELLHVLEGEVEVTVLTEDSRVETTVRAGSVFVCPKGLWHRQHAPSGVTILYATPAPSEHSWADDPRIAC